MVGEGLLVHHSDGGFLVPVREPGELIELLAWHMQLIAATLTRLSETVMREALHPSLTLSSAPSPVSLATLAAAIFSSLAAATGNRQPSIEVRRPNDRLHDSRHITSIEPESPEKKKP